MFLNAGLIVKNTTESSQDEKIKYNSSFSSQIRHITEIKYSVNSFRLILKQWFSSFLTQRPLIPNTIFNANIRQLCFAISAVIITLLQAISIYIFIIKPKELA